MGVASGCGEQEAGVASGSGWNLWVWLLSVVVRRYIDFLLLLIPTPLFFFAAAPYFLFIFYTCIRHGGRIIKVHDVNRRYFTQDVTCRKPLIN